MDSRFDSQANREMVSSMSKPTDARSSAMASPDGKPLTNKNQDGLGSIFEFFETLVQDVKKNFADRNEANDPLVNSLETNIRQMRETFEQITGTLGNYDEKLVNVLGQHQDDFWFAFKTHMNKIQKELQFLQAKSKEQDAKLTQDVRIIGLEEQLKWYQHEFKGLMEVKERNDQAIKHLKDQCKNLGVNSDEMRTQVKAAKRQNKLLGVALTKAKNHRSELVQLNDQIEEQKSSLRKESIRMPNLMFSPFLPLSQQLESQQKELEVMDSDMKMPVSNLVGPDDSFQRLNNDLPQYQEDLVQTEVVVSNNPGGEVPTAGLQQQISAGGVAHQLPQSQQQQNIAAASSIYDNAEMGGMSQVSENRMESIPEEVSKANLHSSHSKIGMHANGSQHSHGGAGGLQGLYNPTSMINPGSIYQTQESTVLQQYVKDLVTAGKSEAELITDLESYYDTLVQSCDTEILDLKEELEFEKAAQREQAADEVYLKANEIDELSNIFIDCIHAHRKTLRQQLVKMKFKEAQGGAQQDDPNQQWNQSRTSGMDQMGTKTRKPNLLQTYLRIVKTGAPEEIEKFSQIERQKLVELLVTNQELLNFMFDKMFKNNYDPKEREQILLSKMTLSEHAFDPGSLEQLQHDDPLELLQRSTELRRAHEQSQTVTKYANRILKPVGSTGASRTQNVKMPYFYSQTKTQTHGPRQADQQLNMQKMMLDRKQRSMAIGVGRSGAIDEITASPLLLQQNAKGERQTLRGYDSLNEAQQLHGSFKQTEKVASDFGKNVFHHLSNVDTDKMQNQFLSNKDVDQAKPSQKSIVLPTITQRQGTEMPQSAHDVPTPLAGKEGRTTINKTDVSSRSSKNGGFMTAQHQNTGRSHLAMAPMSGPSKNNLLTGKSQRQLRAMSTRPLIHIRDGKLMLSGQQQMPMQR